MASPCQWNATKDEVLLRGQHWVLELIAEGKPLTDALDALCRTIEDAIDGTHCSILLLDPAGKHLRHAAAPSLPKAYCELINGEPVGPQAGSCGTAAFRRARVVVEDVSSDPLWAYYKDVALKFGLAACASTPIFAGPERAVLGTFAIYHMRPGPFSDEELRLLDSMQDLATIAIINHQREQIVQHLQKEESLAVLAGGVAHDFNNLLTVIAGNISLLKVISPDDVHRTELLQNVEAAIERATGLTHQLLAFTGKANFRIEPVQLNNVLRDITRLLSVTMSKKVILQLDLADNLPLIEADATQLQQVVLNLVTNASEAVGDSESRIGVATGVVTLSDFQVRRRLAGQAMRPGDYVAVEVEDNGPGMVSDVAARIFEPFFTTKSSGRGLGLATLLGIVKSHRGGVELDTQPGRGTRFTLYFPVAAITQASARQPVTEEPASEDTGQRCVLLVDDEEAIRNVLGSMLEHLGHRVLMAADGNEALEVLTTHGADVAVAILDMQMPRMDGVEAMDVIRRRWPAIRIVLSSGNESSRSIVDERSIEDVQFLQKPYSLEKLRRILSTAQTSRNHSA